MSGGHWNYLQHRFNDAADDLMHGRVRGADALHILGQIERELDWGWSNDTCLACARLRVIAGLETYFDVLAGHYGDEGPEAVVQALAVLHDGTQHRCPGCEARQPV